VDEYIELTPAVIDLMEAGDFAAIDAMFDNTPTTPGGLSDAYPDYEPLDNPFSPKDGHRYIPDTGYVLDTSGEACVVCAGWPEEHKHFAEVK